MRWISFSMLFLLIQVTPRVGFITDISYQTLPLLTVNSSEVQAIQARSDFSTILEDHQESLKELLELEKEEDNNVSTLRSISLSLLEINSRLKSDNWEETSKSMLDELIKIDPIRKGYYLSRISKLQL